MRYLAVIICLAIAIPVFGQRKKKDEDVVIAPTYTEGIVYALPRTGIKVYVKAVQEKVVAGPYSGYADQLLGIKNAVKSNSSKWSISDIEIEIFSEPDPDNVFKAMGEGAFLLNLTADGCLVGINSENTFSGLKPVKTNILSSRPAFETNFSFDYITDTPFYIEGDSTNGYQPIRVSSQEKAAEAAKRVLECRVNQYEMAAGIYDELPDGDAYRMSMEEMKKMEKSYLSLFVGRTTYEKETFSFDFVPTIASSKGQVIFRISDEKGIVPASDLSGKPVTIEFEQSQGLAGKFKDLASSENPSAGESGIYYRMPGYASIKIIHELKQIATAHAAIAQFGVIAPVPEDLLFGDYSLEFHPETGAIKSVNKK